MRDSTRFTLYFSMIGLFFGYTLLIYFQPEPNGRFSEQASRGKAIWQRKNCVACHQIYGLGGFLGPDLSEVMSAPGKGNDYVKAYIRSGTATMPAFDLTDHEMEEIVAFLIAVDESGSADPRKFKKHANGTIEP